MPKSITRDAAMFTQVFLSGMFEELDRAEAAVKSAADEAKAAEKAGYDPSDDMAETIAYAAVDRAQGYRDGLRHALARTAGILGFTGPNWLDSLRQYAERT
jgi:hypothetical protein